MSALLRNIKPLVFQKSVRSFHSSVCFGDIKPFLLADIGEGITECEVVQWFVKPGASVNEFDKICEVQSDKASVEISSRYTGNVVKLYYTPNQVAKVGSPLIDIEVEDAEEETAVVQEEVDTLFTKKGSDAALWQVPSVRHLLNQYDLSLSQLSGSGKSGRVLKHDVLEYITKHGLRKKERKRAVQQEIKAEPITQQSPMVVEGQRLVPLTPLQKVMFQKMTHSLTIPHLGYKDELELNATRTYRASLNDYIAKSPANTFRFQRISYLPIFIKSLSLSLCHFPILNAKQQPNSIEYRDHHHIGIAMDTPHGLVVPNIKHVERKTMFELAAEIHRLTQLAKQGTLDPSELEGGTITLSNLGSIGGTYAQPVIEASQMAIVSLGSAKKLPRFDRHTNKIEPKYIMPISWSADHRVIDGATMAQFSNLWKSFIENPALLSSQLQ
ncbi:2-oxoacid dehydrogenases acyltransferase-domain-containing protein [Sporodiniella umbellata]|nr:2-oxoacid dehydrogenases acyltransferase-domain-containing protein [Sporodiniella umbellata]